MNIFVRHCFAVLAATLLFAGCSPPQHGAQVLATAPELESAHLSTGEVVRVARETAKQKGVHLQEYKEPAVDVRSADKGKIWFVHFEGRAAIVGNRFLVTVDDQTGEARYHGAQ